MPRANIANPEFTYDADDPDGFHAGMYRMGPSFGATRTGTSVYELPPGEALCPYHYEYAEEEWLLVLEGTPTLRTAEETVELAPWDIAFFQTGPDGAHQIRNDSDATARVLMWSEVTKIAATVYPDSDKIGIWTGNDTDSMLVERSAKVDYYHGETG